MIILFYLLLSWCKLENDGITLKSMFLSKKRFIDMCWIGLIVHYPNIIIIITIIIIIFYCFTVWLIVMPFFSALVFLLCYFFSISIIEAFHSVKSFRIRGFSGAYFPAFGPEKLWIRTLFTQCCLFIVSQVIICLYCQFLCERLCSFKSKGFCN